MVLVKRDFVVIDYTAKMKETGKIFDTTIKEVAEKEKMAKEGQSYNPQLIVLGEGWLPKAVDEGLENLTLDKPIIVEIPPDKAFGQRDPAKVKIVPLSLFTSKGISPKVGMNVEYSGKSAVIRTVGSGR